MNDELLARCRSFVDEQSCGEWDDKAINEDAAKLYEFVQREAASALRLAAQSPEPVAWIDFADNGNVRLWTHKKARMSAEEAEGRKMTPVYTATPQPAPVAVKPLEWSDAGEVIFQKWCAKTHFDTGYVLTKQFIGLKDPLYLIHHEDEFLGRFDDEATAKSAAQADYEQRIRSALVSVPAVDGALREALEAIRPHLDTIVCYASTINEHEGNRVAALVEKALAASEATKSDGGVKIPFGAMNDDPSAPGFKPSPSDTRPADVTVEVRAKIDWWLREISDCNERMWNGSREMYFGQIDKGVDAIRALLDTHKIGAK
ncbi:hypothetical protein [Afipia carboxidovorans]|uniref:hypothetical protein n=1 Tax=Afipia carboxidovorans TaxID=40137 RepID=UPI003092805A|nr:hypothetical protein CRBSH125_34900 [Afipia carboxidovorans]